jgi:hypothetical protein
LWPIETISWFLSAATFTGCCLCCMEIQKLTVTTPNPWGDDHVQGDLTIAPKVTSVTKGSDLLTTQLWSCRCLIQQSVAWSTVQSPRPAILWLWLLCVLAHWYGAVFDAGNPPRTPMRLRIGVSSFEIVFFLKNVRMVP